VFRCEFRKVNGHCVVPRSNGRLGAWVEKQRIEYKKYLRAVAAAAVGGGGAGVGCDDDGIGAAAAAAAAAGGADEGEGAPPKTILTEGRVRKLDDVGFVWDVRERQFERRLGQLRIHLQANYGGGGRPDPRTMNGSLAAWVRKHERLYRRYLDAAAGAAADDETLWGTLPENRRIALEGLGFCRGMFDGPRASSAGNRRATWEERYEELGEYKAEVRRSSRVARRNAIFPTGASIPSLKGIPGNSSFDQFFRFFALHHSTATAWCPRTTDPLGPGSERRGIR
jgi:hypothetical protein